MLLKQLDNFLNKYYQQIYILLFFVFFLLLLIGTLFRDSPILSPDSTTFYNWSSLLINQNFNVIQFFKNVEFITPIEFYIIPIILISILRVLFDSYWAHVFISFNLVFILSIYIIFFQALKNLAIDYLGIILGLCLFIFTIDYILWPVYVLTDSIFSLIVAYSIYYLLTKKNHSLLIVLFLSLVLIFTRPTGVVYASCILISYIILFFNDKHPIFMSKKYKFFFFLLPFLTMILLFFISLFYIFLNEEIFLTKGLNKSLSYILEGVVIHHRPETYLNDVESNVIDIFLVLLNRFILFFSPYARNFSVFHLVCNFISIGSFLFFLICDYIFLLKKKLNVRHLKLKLILLLSIIILASFHSMTLIDYDWRYRFPLLFLFLLYSVCSIDNFIKKLKDN